MESSPDDQVRHVALGRPYARADLDDVLPHVYEELRRVAHRYLHAAAAETFCTTDLVHELYLKLATTEPVRWESRAHFMAIAAVAMRYILVDRARRRTAAKRGGERVRVTLEDNLVDVDRQADALVELDDALTALSSVDERLAQVVEMRFFGGMTDAETATVLGITERTVRRDWTKARGLLYQSLAD
jgi:RNA polymerase sigma factor (TIGR02999 family)